ncbi:2,3-diaminopropionate biosynthesis protein SbnB [Ideonella sp.]|jgi:2,3-diaminopropionate biosynthesis protein SbnB|uniref:2,3-diaminopropionate biosynthesis protein SbnB n=1 Tax=Ideonella sp. TaxID=1929293 RepID=UPI0037C1529F
MQTSTPYSRELTLLGLNDVAAQLQGQELALIDLAAQAYVTHSRGDSRLPQSEYLRFPNLERERIIPKAGYLGGAHPAAGIKWISSFPDNVGRGMPRASALIILNSVQDGRPTTVMEGSLISGQRTAASAALAARLLHQGDRVKRFGLVGCGPINREVLRFVLADRRPIDGLGLFDLDSARAEAFAQEAREAGFTKSIEQFGSADDLLADCELVSFATSAVVPSVSTLSMCPPNSTILHVSLRDFTPEAILEADNIADDVEHVLQANTSLHRTQQLLGHSDFLRGTLAQVIEGMTPARAGGRPVMFNPFGLAALDLAFAEFVARTCRAAGRGAVIPDFLP